MGGEEGLFTISEGLTGEEELSNADVDVDEEEDDF